MDFRKSEFESVWQRKEMKEKENTVQEKKEIRDGNFCLIRLK